MANSPHCVAGRRTLAKRRWAARTSHHLHLTCLFMSLVAVGACNGNGGATLKTTDAEAARVGTGNGNAEGSPQACPPGAPQPVDRVRFVPAPGQAARMVGGSIQGSNTSPTNDFVVLAEIDEPPAEGTYNELRFDNEVPYRYIKYYSPADSHGNVAELEFYAGDERLTGAPFGTAGSRDHATFERALDGDPATYFDAETATGNYVGLDLGGDRVVQKPTFSPSPEDVEDEDRISITSATERAAIRYTLDGSRPTREHGTLYEGPIALPTGRAVTLNAVAYADCYFDSEVAQATYRVGFSNGATRGQRSYHIGNSLTDTINPWLKPIADSTGVEHDYARWTIPGSPIGWLWEHQGEGFEDPPGANRFTSFVQSFAPIDHISVQPFADSNLTTQGGAARAMFEAARAHSPDVQFWIYAQWPGQTEWRSDALARGAPWNAPESEFPPAPTNWEEAVQNQLRFHELFRAYVDEGVDGKPVRIVPAGSALVNLKRAIEAGQVPGITQFFPEHFSDDLHLSPKGAYLVALTFYACLYGQSPEGRVTHANSGLTDDQARVYQRIAWETVRDYPWSGVE